MMIREKEFFYEFEIDSTVRLIYTKQPFCLSIKEIHNDNFSFIPNTKEIKYLKQLHTNTVCEVSLDFINFCVGDGFVTKLTDVALLTYHADCLPIYFYDTVNKTIGLTHSGYRGSFNLIALNMLNLLQNIGSNFKNIKVVLGPSNKFCSYEVQEEFLTLFEDKFSKDLINCSFTERAGKLYFDNEEFIFKLLSNFNLEVYKTKLCTYCSDKLYSHRKNKDTRSFACIWRI